MTDGPKRCLLVIDDDAATRMAYEISLESPAWTVVTAANAVEALTAIQREQPFMVISDVGMDRFAGTDLFKALRMDPRFKDLAFLFVTGTPQLEVQRALPLNDPRLRIVTKPPDYPRIFAVIKELTGVDGAAR